VQNNDSIAVITKWHIQRGFSGDWLYYFISKNGDVHDCRSLEEIPAAQKNHNRGSIAICLHGLKTEKFTKNNMSWLKLSARLLTRRMERRRIRFRGHCEVSSKSCPVFDYKIGFRVGQSR